MAGVCYQDGVFPLCRETVVLGNHGPAIRQQFGVSFAGIHHGFDRERHAGFEFHASARFAVVQYLRILVKFTTNPMSAVLAHN